MSQLRFQRANFVVTDLERALQFYRDVLGFEVAFVKDSPEDSYSYQVFEIPPATPMRFAVLSTEAQPRVMALTELDLPVAPAPVPRRSAIVLECPEIDRVVAASEQLGLVVYPEDHLETQDGRHGREVGIVDFDGNLVVLYTITRAAPIQSSGRTPD